MAIRSLSLLTLALLLPPVSRGSTAPPPGIATAVANDNRRAAGHRRGDTLFVALEVRVGRWYPEGATGDFVEAPVIGEVGRAAQVPAPLLRVRTGTLIIARLTNTLADSAVTWRGGPGGGGFDSVVVRPGGTVTRQFRAGAPGTYLYGAQAGAVDWAVREREQAYGAFVVDSIGARTDDRIFVLNVWGDGPPDRYRNALAINGRGWPYTERLTALAGDTLRWRIVNATVRVHPMHLHGFYFRLLATGVRGTVTPIAPARQPMLVTETMAPFSTMDLQWVAGRAGNWLFHCHLAFHAVADTRYTAGFEHADHASGDAGKHMAGLVMGIDVRAPESGGRATVSRVAPRTLRLHVQEGARRGVSPRALGFVLQEGPAPAADSIRIPGSPLILTRGQPTDITVLNHLREPTTVHWHGIELESYSDGVAGWSGTPTRHAPAIAPGDSFVAHLTLPRAGTFIYHTHLNDIVQLTSGLYGGLVVLEPGQRYDPVHDHLFVVGWDGPKNRLLVNGDSLPAPYVLARGATHRLRFVFIGAVNGNTLTLADSTGPVMWRAVARDGYEMPPAQRDLLRAQFRGWAGQTWDFELPADRPGRYRLTLGNPAKPAWTGEMVVR